MPRESATKRKIFAFMECNDVHKWVAGREKGRRGFEHWQIRFETSSLPDDKEGESFRAIKDWFNEAHIERDASDEYDYEKKEGRYFCSDDNGDKLRQRYGKLRPVQSLILSLADESNDREIVLWYDDHGRSGKSWFTGALWERRSGYYCPPYLESVKEIIQFVASGYSGQPYVVIDMPRDTKWTKKIYTGIEAIKDGLVAEPRYHADTQNIRGVKVIVLSNTMPQLDRLSEDRWVIYRDERP